MATLFTAQAIRRQDHHEVQVASAGAAYNPGDLVINCVGDGRCGVVAGLEAVASGDPVTFYVNGQFDVNCASATTFSAGDKVYWDDTNNVAKTTATGGYIYIGRAVKAKTSGQLVVLTELNVIGKTIAGTVTLDGSNPTPVTTGLTTIDAAQVSLNSSSAPGDDPSWLSCDWTGGTLNIYAWKNTGGTDPTLVASTNNSAVVSWVVFGV